MKKIALVTGGSRGLGRDMALNIAKKGIDLVITYHQNEDGAIQTAQEIEKLGQEAHVFRLDTRDVSSFESFLKNMSSTLKEKRGSGKIDFLVNNAGIGADGVLATQHATDIARVFPATLELATLGTLIGVIIGVPMGVIAAVRQGSWIDQIARFVGLIGYSMPIFWLGLVGLLVFYGILGWVAGPGRLSIFYQGMVEPITGMLLVDSLIRGEWAVFRDAFSHIILPASLLGYFSLAYISRMTRSFMLEQLSAEYVTTARVKGLSEWQVIWGHAFRNIRIQLVTVIALAYANLLEGSVLTEIIFAWPGLGSYITTSLLANDMNSVLGGTIVIGTIFVAINIFSDLLYRIFDPRSK